MSSYKNIVKTTGLIGLVQVFQIIFGLVRNKFLALLVGAKGFGIWGLYNTYVEMASSLSILGLDQSGVRQIAKSDDDNYIAKCIYVFRNTVLIISGIFTLISIFLSKIVSKAIFDTDEYYWGVVIVSFAILFKGIYSSQRSILNGLRDIRALAISQIIGAIIGSISAIIAVYFLGIEGIPIYILIVAITASITTWWYVRKLKIKKVIPTHSEAKHELKTLFSLGIGFSVAGIVAAVMTYFSRLYLSAEFSLEAVGVYQASWTISNLYIGTILTAMGVDLMPRMMKVVDSNKGLNTLVNEQMELGFLISGIGVVGILIFSPLVLQIFFSKEFLVGTSIIRWQVLGVCLRVLAFPFSYAIMAKGKSIAYIIIQSIFWTLEFGFLILFSKLFGFDGLGVNYLVGYCFYLGMSWFVCRKLFDFHISYLLGKILMITFLFIGTAFSMTFLLDSVLSMLFGSALLIVYAYWIVYMLKSKMDMDVIAIVKNKLK